MASSKQSLTGIHFSYIPINSSDWTILLRALYELPSLTKFSVRLSCGFTLQGRFNQVQFFALCGTLSLILCWGQSSLIFLNGPDKDRQLGR